MIMKKLKVDFKEKDDSKVEVSINKNKIKKDKMLTNVIKLMILGDKKQIRYLLKIVGTFYFFTFFFKNY